MVETFSYPSNGSEIEKRPLAQIVTLNFYPQKNLVIQYLEKNPQLAHTPRKRQDLQIKYALPAYNVYQKSRENGQDLTLKTRGINAGVLIFDPVKQHTLWVVKDFNGRHALDVPAGTSRRIGGIVNLYHTALREGLAEEAVLIANGRELILPAREPEYALREVESNLQRARKAGLSETKAQMLDDATRKSQPSSNGKDSSLLRAQELELTTVRTVYPDKSFSEEEGVFVFHQEGADLLFPFILPKADDLIITDLECVLRNGEQIALNRNHVWLGQDDLTSLLEGGKIKADFANGGQVDISSQTHPFCSLGMETARLLVD